MFHFNNLLAVFGHIKIFVYPLSSIIHNLSSPFSIFLIFQPILGQMAYNVSAVYDIFASPIKETVGFQGLQKCGWS
jgi:hypothetical protein